MNAEALYEWYEHQMRLMAERFPAQFTHNPTEKLVWKMGRTEPTLEYFSEEWEGVEREKDFRRCYLSKGLVDDWDKNSISFAKFFKQIGVEVKWMVGLSGDTVERVVLEFDLERMEEQIYATPDGKACFQTSSGDVLMTVQKVRLGNVVLFNGEETKSKNSAVFYMGTCETCASLCVVVKDFGTTPPLPKEEIAEAFGSQFLSVTFGFSKTSVGQVLSEGFVTQMDKAQAAILGWEYNPASRATALMDGNMFWTSIAGSCEAHGGSDYFMLKCGADGASTVPVPKQALKKFSPVFAVMINSKYFPEGQTSSCTVPFQYETVQSFALYCIYRVPSGIHVDTDELAALADLYDVGVLLDICQFFMVYRVSKICMEAKFGTFELEWMSRICRVAHMLDLHLLLVHLYHTLPEIKAKPKSEEVGQEWDAVLESMPDFEAKLLNAVSVYVYEY